MTINSGEPRAVQVEREAHLGDKWYDDDGVITGLSNSTPSRIPPKSTTKVYWNRHFARFAERNLESLRCSSIFEARRYDTKAPQLRFRIALFAELLS